MITEAHLAYAAGIIDGEGCIYIGRHRRKDSGGRTYFVMSVRVAMLSATVPRWLMEHFGGNLRQARNRSTRTGTNWIWALSQRRAEGFLRDLSPFLVEKADQAKLAIEFQALARSYPRTARQGAHGRLVGRAESPAQLRVDQEAHFWKLHFLKRVVAA